MGALDLQIFHFLYGLSEKLNISHRTIVFVAEYIPYILLAVTFVYLLYSSMSRHQRIRAAISLIIAATLSSLAVTQAIRLIWHRPRPFVSLNLNEIVYEASHSFPSAHSAVFFALSTVIYFYSKRLGILFFITTAIICFGRILAGVHYPSDILAGLVVGVLSGIVARYVENIILRRFFRR